MIEAKYSYRKQLAFLNRKPMTKRQVALTIAGIAITALAFGVGLLG